MKRNNDRGEEERDRPRVLWRILRMVGFVIGGVVLAAFFALVLGLVVQWLWNWLMPDIFGLKAITYWQAFGLLFLSKLLFGGLRHDHRPYRNKKRIHREKRGHWKDYGRFWRQKGEETAEEFIERAQKKRGETE